MEQEILQVYFKNVSIRKQLKNSALKQILIDEVMSYSCLFFFRSKQSAGMGDSRRKLEKMVAELNNESDSTSTISEYESGGSDDVQKFQEANNTYEKMMKDMKSRQNFGGKEAEAHKKTADWMSSTRGEQTKKKEGPGCSTKPKQPFLSSSGEDSDVEQLTQQLKSKMTMPAKKGPQDRQETVRKMMASMTEKPIKVTATTPKVAAAPLKKTGAAKAGVAARTAPADKARPKKKT